MSKTFTAASSASHAVSVLVFAGVLLLSPTQAFAQTSSVQTSASCQSSTPAGTEITHRYPSGALWSVCATLDPIVGLYLQDLAYQAPGDSLRRTFSELHLAGILEHYHDEPAERSVFETLRFGSDDFVSFTANTCTGGGTGTLIELPREAADLNSAQANSGNKICTIEYADKILAKFDNASITQNHSWDIIAAASNGLDTWEVVVTLGEEGTIGASINRGGRLHQFSNNTDFGSNPIDTTPASLSDSDATTPVNNLAVNSTLKTTWRIVPAMGATATGANINEATQVIEQLDFRLAPESGNRRPMSVETLNVETLRQVNREQFRRWQVKGEDGAGYLIDVQNNGFDYRSRQHNWALFDAGFTRHNACEKTTLDNADNFAPVTENPSGSETGGTGSESDVAQCADSLQDFVNGESLQNTTPVIWFSQTLTITPDADDWPLLRTRTLSFDLVPFDWTQSSPFAPTPSADSGLGKGS